MTPAWLTTYIFNKPTNSYYFLWPQEAICPACGSESYLSVAKASWCDLLRLLPDQTKLPVMHHSALCQA